MIHALCRRAVYVLNPREHINSSPLSPLVILNINWLLEKYADFFFFFSGGGGYYMKYWNKVTFSDVGPMVEMKAFSAIKWPS